MTLRRLPLFPLFAVALCGVACPTPSDDDDTAALDDDDAVGTDPCVDVQDISAEVAAGESVTGGTNSESDDFSGSCDTSDFGSNDALFVFTPAATGTYIATTDDPSTDFDTQIVAFTDCEDPAGSEIGCNDDIDGDANILTSTLSLELVAGVPVYLAVDGFESVGHYELSISPVICGDGLVFGDEMCDDGNTAPDDGCDASCVWECDDDDREDDDTVETAAELGELPATVVGTLCPTDSTEELGAFVDFSSLDLTVGEFATVSVAPTGGGDCEDLVVGLGVYDAALTLLSTDQFEEGECPVVSMEAAVTGRYYVAVAGADVTVPPQDYTLTVSAGLAECGDGEIEGLEECDDGNVDPDDACSDTCTVNDATCTVAGPVTTAANVTGDTAGAGDDHVATCAPPGEDVVFQFDSDADQIVIATTALPGTPAATDTVLHVRGQCRNAATALGCNDDVAQDDYRSILGFRAEAGETYFIIVDTYDTDAGPFELGLSLATCGDGNVEPGEDCDDANQIPEDGCENDCSITVACVYPPDQDLGLLATGVTNETVDLASAADPLPDLPCSAPGGNDWLVRLEVGTAGTLSIAVDHTGGDVQYALFADDGTCSAASACVDLGAGVPTGTVQAAVAPGAYFLVLDSWGADGVPKTTVDLAITAP